MSYQLYRSTFQASRAISKLLWLCLFLLLSACAVHHSPLEEVDQASDPVIQARWQAQQKAVSAIEGWKIKGKIAVKAGKKGGHASLRWDKEPQTEHIELAGPLGGGRVVIDKSEQGARLQDTRGGDLKGDSVAELVAQRLGWPLPFEQLPLWLRGLPAGSDAEIQWQDDGRVSRMNDSGWQVSYPQYQSIVMEGGELLLPRTIELNALPGTLKVYDRNGEFLGEDFFVRLIVKSWVL